MFTGLDYAVLVIYLLGVAALGIKAAGRQTSTTDYFLGSRQLPWWAVCFSVVATETSTLTVIGIPAVASSGSFTFFQLTFGYLLGRILVSFIFLPQYFRGNLTTAYAFLGRRYGDGMRAAASVTFLVTRLLADGVRLFATAIPLKVIAQMAGFTVSYFEIIVVIGVVTMVYTFIGGIKAVVWMDVVQMFLYVGGAVAAIFILLGQVPGDWWLAASEAGKTKIFDFGWGKGLNYMLTSPYAFPTAVFGGAIFSMASHGTDQLIVQRLLACRGLSDSRKALIGSAVVVMMQFAIFLLVGLLLWSFYGGVPPSELGLSRTDEIFPMFIIKGMPPGVSGLLLAGILAAAMSTLSSSLNALASSTMMDLYERFFRRSLPTDRALRLSRWMTLFWGIVFIVFANLFRDQQNPVVELGLAIASFTYGGLLGVFLLGLINRRTEQKDAMIGFFVSIASMVLIIFGVWHSPADGWLFELNPTDEYIAAAQLRSIGWPWYTLIGTVITLVIGSLSALVGGSLNTLRHTLGGGA